LLGEVVAARADTLAQLGEQRTEVQTGLSDVRQVVLAKVEDAQEGVRAHLNEQRSEFEAGFGDLRRIVAESYSLTEARLQSLEQTSSASDARTQSQVDALAETNRSIGARLDAATTMLVAGQAKLFDRLDRIEAAITGEAAVVRGRLAAIESGLLSDRQRSERVEADVLASMEISARMGLWIDNKVEETEASLARRIDASVAKMRAAVAAELRSAHNAQLESVGRAVADMMIELDRRQPEAAKPTPPPRRHFALDGASGPADLLPTPKAAVILRGARETIEEKPSQALPEAPRTPPTQLAPSAIAAQPSQAQPPAQVIRVVQPVQIVQETTATAVTQVRAIDLTAIPGELITNVDLSQTWTNLGWSQSGATLAAGGVVQVASGAHWPGFVTARMAAKGGGVISVTVDVAECPPGGNLVARIRNDKDEQCGPDVPLSKGINTFRVFAPQRSENLKAYVLVRPPTTGGAFAVKSIKIERLDSDAHQRAVRLSIGQPVLASMASIPSRRRMLEDCINSLLAQCDRVRVFLNNYPDVPDFLNHPRIDVRRSQDWDDRGDAGKVHWIDRDKEEGYRLVTDDDLLFPPDFSETMCGKVQAFSNRAIFCTHGVLLRQPVVQYYDPDSRAATFHFARQLDADTTVHIGATNAMCFHSSAVQMKWNDFSYCNSADIWISLYAQRHKLPVLAASRLQGWVRENTHDAPEDTIYNHSRKRTKSRMDSSLVQDAALRHAAPLTLQPTHRPKLGLAIIVDDVVGLKSFLDAWSASRSTHVDWVISLIPASSPETFREAIGKLVIEHETHLFDSSASLRDRIQLARRLAGELGILATMFVPQQMRFTKAGWEGGLFSPGGLGDALLMLRDVAPGQLGVTGAGDGAAAAAFIERSVSQLALPRAGAGAEALRLDGTPSQVVAQALADVFAGPLVKGPAVIRTDRTPSGRRINDMFERVVVLNLDRRPDRWAQAQHQLAQAGITAERFSAVDGGQPEVDAEYQEYAALPLVTTPQGLKEVRYSEDFYINPESQMARIAHLEQRSGRKAVASRGAWGYLKSYRTILEQAMKDQVESLLVFDDDMLMHRKTEQLFEAVSQELPPNWLLLQLGTLQYNWKFPWFERASEHLYRTRGSAIGSHAVGIRFEMMPFLLDHASRMDMPFDVGALSAAVHAFHDRSFVTLPNLAIQRLGAASDISTSDFQKMTDVIEVAKTYRWDLQDYFDDKDAAG
jgi:GR25 family glycosyltransferase involved in LPS biosynthesis